jgi:amino acid transporter
MEKKDKNLAISMPAAISIGIGGMIGAGIFSILGVVARASGTAMWLSFIVGGIVALFSTYSYAKLGARFPSAGGAVSFLVESFGVGFISGSFNIFMWFGYIISIALYAQGFAAYFVTFLAQAPNPWLSKCIASVIVILFAALNIFGAGSVGRAEILIVGIKVSILVLFAVTGLFFMEPTNLSWQHFSGFEHLFFGAGILFIGYEGFGLITNAAGAMDNPQKNLPKALYISVFIVIAIYIAVSLAVVGNLSINQISSAGDDALAAAARPFLGDFGYKLIAIAALFSTASAINATLFGAANVSYMVARDGELPNSFAFREWKGATGGLFITTLLVILFILLFDLSGIAMMGSGAFLLIYAVVNAGHLRILDKTGAKKSIVLISLLLCLSMFVILEIYTYEKSRLSFYTMFIILACSFLSEVIYRKLRGKL